MTQILALLLAAAVLIGVPLMLLGSAIADERAWSRQPSNCGSTIAGHARPKQVSGWTGVEPPPALAAAPPVPPNPVDAVAPLTASTGFDSPPSPQAPVGAGPTGTPQPVPCVHRATALVGDVSPVPSPTSFQGDHRG